MSKLFVVLALFAILAVSLSKTVDTRNLWKQWKLTHKKLYSAKDEPIRYNVFVNNFYTIEKMNRANGTAKVALNKFADLTNAEFKQKYMNSKFSTKQNHTTKKFNATALPDTVDWRNKGAVTPVKDQGQCGSCWAFSTTGLLEGFYFVNHGQLISFSEQQLVDCATSAGYGCQGGWPYLATDYACKQGLETESDYPYTARDGQCHYDASKAVKVCNGYQFVTPKSTDQLKAAIVNFPTSVLVEADQSVFQFYSSGVISTGCGTILNHAVTAVGYQKVGVLEAFTVKNSWGTSWGSSGYVYISTIQQINNGQGACGILAQPVTAN